MGYEQPLNNPFAEGNGQRSRNNLAGKLSGNASIEIYLQTSGNP